MSIGRKRCCVACQADGRRPTLVRINNRNLTALLYLQGYGRGEFVAERRVMEVLAEVVGYESWQTTVPWPELVSRCMPSRWSSLNPYPHQLLRPDRAALPVMRRPRRVRDRADEVKEGGWRRELLIWATAVLFRNRCRGGLRASRRPLAGRLDLQAARAGRCSRPAKGSAAFPEQYQ